MAQNLPRLGSMSVETLLKLREDIGKVLSAKRWIRLKDQLSRLVVRARLAGGRGGL